MSVLFLPPSAGAASVPDATETVSGKIRIATSAEATAGTNDVTAMTPAKTKSVVDAAVVGGVTYQGTFDASAPADLSNATKGDLYIISVAGTYQGQTWAVGDHLLINADMGGTLDPAKIDKVDNTDSVTSVAGRTGAVVLSAGDVSGLATVATSGAYSDLSGTPSLATVATTGAYSDLTGTPTLGTAAAEDVGTSANNVVQLNGSAQLPAVDGSLLTDLPSDVRSITSNSSITISAPTRPEFIAVRIQPVSVGQTVTLPAGASGSTVLIANDNASYSVTVQTASGSLYFRNAPGNVTLLPNQTLTVSAFSTNWIVTDFNYLNLSVSSPANGEALVYNSTSGLWENSTVSASVAALDDIGDVDTTGAVATNVLKYDGVNWVDGAVAYSEVTGTPTLATIATTGDYSDLNDSVVVQQFNATATAAAISSNALHVFRLYGAGGFTLTLSTSTAINGFALFNNISGSDVTVNGGTFRANGEGVTGGSSSITVKAGERRLYYVEQGSLYLESNSTLIGNNADVTITSPSNGEALIYNSTSGDWENGTISATVAALNDIGDVSAAAPNNGDVIAYNSTSGDWEAAAQSVSAPSVTVSSPSTSQTLSAPSGIEEAYIYTPTTAITVNLVAAATCGSGFKYQIKNRSTNTITIDPSGAETVDGSSTFTLSTQEASVTLITDGSNWFII